MEIASHLAIPYFKRLKKVFFCSQQYSQGKYWCFTQFNRGMTGWQLLIFFICLHSQLSSIHSIISTDV